MTKYNVKTKSGKSYTLDTKRKPFKPVDQLKKQRYV